MINKRHLNITVLLLSLIMLCACAKKDTIDYAPKVESLDEPIEATNEEAINDLDNLGDFDENAYAVRTADNAGNRSVDDAYVRILPGTNANMLSADYWLDKYYEEGGSKDVIMSLDEIKSFNSNNENIISINGAEFTQLGIVDTMDGKIVRDLVDLVEPPKNPGELYLNGKSTTREYWNELHELLNLEAIEDTVKVKYGYSVDRQSLRAYPSNDFVGENKEDEFFDQAVMSEFMPYLPLVIIHESEDEEWYYVVTYGFCGWIEKKYVALCHNREEWLSYMNPEEVLVVTGREIKLPDVQGDERISGLLLPMGTVMPIVRTEDQPASVHGRNTYNNYVVKLMVKGEDGFLEEEYGLISVKEDVNVGYLPYTTENVLRQEFKLLGDRYGWAGLGHSDDCSGTVRMVYNCFGFTIPRTGGMQMAVSGLTHHDMTDMSDSEKIDTINALMPGSFVNFPGHIMMYIGSIDGEPYVISSVSTFATLDMPDGSIMKVNTVTVNNLVKTKRKSGKTWLSSMTQALELKLP